MSDFHPHGDAAIYDSICVVYNTQGDFKKAIHAGEKAYELNPKLTENLGEAYCQENEWQKVEELTLKVIQIDPQNIKAKKSLKSPQIY